jgi:hypothetical protein
MVVTFDEPSQHYEFEKWKEEHPDGRVLNFRTDTHATLHRPGCPTLNGPYQHPEGVKGPQSRTSSMKICGDNEHEVRAHARNMSPPLVVNECNRRKCRGLE